MKTGTRRFILRLLVGILTFIIGVSAAILLGGFNPYNSFSGPTYYRHHDYYYYQRSQTVTPEPAYNYPTYHYHDGCRMRGQFNELPAPPPAPRVDGPMPPSPPPPSR